MKHKRTNKKLKLLGIFLLVSLLCLIGIYAYAKNWEKISEAAEAEKNTPLQAHYSIPMLSHETLPLLKYAEEGDALIEVPLLSQKDSGYITGCELVSASMVLQYYGETITPQQLYEAIDKVDTPVNADGIGVSPHKYFIGNPEKSNGYGCYAEPLINAINKLLQRERYAVNIKDTDLATIERTYLAQDTPVILWATIQMKPPKEGNRWTLEDGTQFQWLAGEHCLVLVGADEDYYYFNDPDYGDEVIGYEKELVQQRYDELGRQAIVISR